MSAKLYYKNPYAFFSHVNTHVFMRTVSDKEIGKERRVIFFLLKKFTVFFSRQELYYLLVVFLHRRLLFEPSSRGRTSQNDHFVQKWRHKLLIGWISPSFARWLLACFFPAVSMFTNILYVHLFHFTILRTPYRFRR